MEILEMALRWIAAPLLGVVAWLLKRVSQMSTEIRVLETKIDAQSEARKQSHAALQQQMSMMLQKLDSIEQYLRKEH